MGSDEPHPPHEANPNPREGFSLVHKRPRMCQFLTVPVCPDFLRRVCVLSPFQCMFAHPLPSIAVEHDKVTVCYAYLWNMCRHGLAYCYFHPPPHIYEALLKKMGMDYQRLGDMEVLGEQDKEESVGTFDTWELNISNARNLLAEFLDRWICEEWRRGLTRWCEQYLQIFIILMAVPFVFLFSFLS